MLLCVAFTVALLLPRGSVAPAVAITVVEGGVCALLFVRAHPSTSCNALVARYGIARPLTARPALVLVLPPAPFLMLTLVLIPRLLHPPQATASAAPAPTAPTARASSRARATLEWRPRARMSARAATRG